MSALLATPVGLLAQEQHLQSISESNFAAQDNAWASERVIDTSSSTGSPFSASADSFSALMHQHLLVQNRAPRDNVLLINVDTVCNKPVSRYGTTCNTLIANLDLVDADVFSAFPCLSALAYLDR